MNPEQQRIAIAEACGWTEIEVMPSQKDPFTDEPGYLGSQPKLVGRLEGKFSKLPDYLSDLNAMHEAEKVLTREQYEQYIVRLYCVVSNEDWEVVKHRRTLTLSPWLVWFVAHATAAQRLEAILRTLNKWTE